MGSAVCAVAAYDDPMRVLALNPYHGGSHAAFLEGWRRHSRHEFDVYVLPAHHWKWRMRHAAVTLAHQVNDRAAGGQTWDLVWCTDMLNLAEFRGLARPAVHGLPGVIYFHENQLTYPVQHPDERDLHFALTNFISARAADAVWFNSDYHRRELLGALRGLLRSMPDHQPTRAVDAIDQRASVMWPGIGIPSPGGGEGQGTPHLIWAARWEHDKNPRLLFDALGRLVERDVDFRVSIIGEQFEDRPACFDEARHWLGDRIARWGWQASREDYLAALAEADVFVSTADHEFFGIAAIEAAAMGCVCVLPRRLAYPETFGEDDAVWYDGDADDLAETLADVIARTRDGSPLCSGAAERLHERFAWPARAAAMDDAVDALADRRPGH